MRRVRVGLAQVNPTGGAGEAKGRVAVAGLGRARVSPAVGAVEANARLVIAGMERARALGCDLVAFPELVLTGYPPEDLLFKPAFIEAHLRAGAGAGRGRPG